MQKKKTQRPSFKIGTCENFQRWKMLLYRRGVLVRNSDTDGRATFNKYSSLTTFVWQYILCVLQMYFHSQKQMKIVTNNMLTGIGIHPD